MGSLNTGQRRMHETVKLSTRHKEVKREFLIKLSEYGNSEDEAKDKIKSMMIESFKGEDIETIISGVKVKLKKTKNGLHHVKLSIRTTIK